MPGDEQVGLASIAPFVSLNQARTFTYVLPESAEMNGDSEDVTQRLSLSTGQLEDLVIDLRQAPPRIREIELPNLLASFDFGHLHVTSLPTLPKSCFTLPSHLKLSRLRQITLTHALNNQPLIQIAPIVARSPCINLVYDLVRSPSTDSGERILSAICDDLCPQDLGAEGSSTAFGHVQLWLANEREVALAKEVLVDCSCTSLEIGVKLSVAPLFSAALGSFS